MTSIWSRLTKGLVATAGGALVLSACATPDPYAVVPCPYIGVLDDAAEITRFKPGGERDISDIEVRGEIAHVNFTCTQPENKNHVIIRVEVRSKYERGMAAFGEEYSFRIFAAVSQREERIIEKRDVRVKVEFDDDDRTVTRKTTIKNIKLPTEGALSPELHNIYIGFALTPAEVAYNRTKDET